VRTTLGGTGLALSAQTKHEAAACAYAQFVADPLVQSTLYTHSGGQPGHRSAWLDETNHTLTGGYFRATLPALDAAYLRPRHRGYLHGFQEKAGAVVQRCLRAPGTERATLTELDQLWSVSQHRTP
jgi:multiple sugar transport system substrate-binding protein